MPSRLRRYDEYGHVHFLTISCYRRLRFFEHDSVKHAFVAGMRRTRERLGIRWIGYVIMPEHVHVLVFPMPPMGTEPVPISCVLQHLKQYVGRHGKEALRSVWSQRRTLGNPLLDNWARGEGAKPFWKTRGYDSNVTLRQSLDARLDYIHANPVTRGLVDRPDQWIWSSHRYYECGDRSLIAMEWDGSWPIV